MVQQKRLFLIVVYGTSVSKSQAYADIMANRTQLDTVLIYDNSSISELDVDLENNVFYFQDKRNIGLNVAYRYAVEFCEKMSIKWLTLFDQDTKIPSEFFGLLNAKLKKVKNTACIVPEIILKNNRKISPFFIERNLFLFNKKGKTICAINSGTTLDVEYFKNTKEVFPDQFPLDFLDYSVFMYINKNKLNIDKITAQLVQNLSVANYRTMNIERFKNFIWSENKFINKYYANRKKEYYFKLICRIMKLGIDHFQISKIRVIFKVLVKGNI